MEGKIDISLPEGFDTSKFNIGVIVARFQTPKLHKLHRELIEVVCSNHEKVIIFLGVSRVTKTQKNPLDFATRKYMIQKKYPNVIVLPQLDQRYDEVWSEILDTQISNVFGNVKALLYGSRDSFIPHYKGKHATVELVSKRPNMSATQYRVEASNKLIKTKAGREGVIQGCYGRYAKPNATVDVVAYTESGRLLLAKKPGEPLWRFVGGYVDVSDESLEMAAKREFKEETQASIGDLIYVGSSKINDWRYRGERDGIMSTLFIGKLLSGYEANDDIEELTLIHFDELYENDKFKDMIMEEHHPLFEKLIAYYDKRNLIKLKQ